MGLAAAGAAPQFAAMFGLDPFSFWIVIAVTLFSGFVKGAVGFAMPMIMMSALGVVPDRAAGAGGADPADAVHQYRPGLPAGLAPGLGIDR
jgi:hypothetical protein